jgi:hypothetical protein
MCIATLLFLKFLATTNFQHIQHPPCAVVESVFCKDGGFPLANLTLNYYWEYTWGIAHAQQVVLGVYYEGLVYPVSKLPEVFVNFNILMRSLCKLVLDVDIKQE